MLTTSQEELRAYCSAWSIPCMEDETNSDVQIPRNRIRHQVLPALAEINPQAESVLARTAAIVAEEHAFLEAEVTRRLPSLVSLPEGAAIPYADYRALDTALRPRAIRRLLDQLGSGRKDVTAAQLHAAAAIRPGQALTLPGGIWLSVYDDHLRVERLGPPPPPVELPLEGTVDWGPWRLTCHLTKEPVRPGESALLFSREALTAPLLAASWQRGGRLRLANGSRSLKRLLTDAGVPPSRRHLMPVLYSGTTPIGVFFTTATVCPPAAGEEAWVVTVKKR